MADIYDEKARELCRNPSIDPDEWIATIADALRQAAVDERHACIDMIREGESKIDMINAINKRGAK